MVVSVLGSGWVEVRWPNGSSNAYRFNRKQRDLVVVRPDSEPAAAAINLGLQPKRARAAPSKSANQRRAQLPAAATSAPDAVAALPDVLAPGTRVRRGSKWKKGDAGGIGVGTVQEHLIGKGFPGFYLVEWEGGIVGRCKYTSRHRSLVAAEAAAATSMPASVGAAVASSSAAVSGTGVATAAAAAAIAVGAPGPRLAANTPRHAADAALQAAAAQPFAGAPSLPLAPPHRQHLRIAGAPSAALPLVPAPGSLRWVQLMRSMAYALAAASPPARGGSPLRFERVAVGSPQPAALLPRRHAAPSPSFASYLSVLQGLAAQVHAQAQSAAPAATSELHDLRRRVAQLERAQPATPAQKPLSSSGLAARLDALEARHGKMSNQLGYLAEKAVLASQSGTPTTAAAAAPVMRSVHIRSLGDALEAADVPLDADGVNALAVRILTPVLPGMLLSHLSNLGRGGSADHPALSATLHVLRAHRGAAADALARNAGVMGRL